MQTRSMRKAEKQATRNVLEDDGVNEAEAETNHPTTLIANDTCDTLVENVIERFRATSLQESSLVGLHIQPLTEEERQRILDAMSEEKGNDSDIVSKTDDDTHSVQRSSLRTLRPGEWVTDSVIDYFFVTLRKRDERFCSEEQGRKRTHFFKSLFISRLLNEGNKNPMEGTYCYNNVKRWSKNVPGSVHFVCH
jgi:hypothetical protein